MMPVKKLNAPEAQVYFSVLIDDNGDRAGITDTLTSYMDLRKFGLSLGYTCCHTRLTQKRPSLLQEKLKLTRFLDAIRYQNIRDKVMRGIENRWPSLARAIDKMTGNPYSFLGINEYFAADKNRLTISSFPKSSRCHITLSDPFLKENEISTHDELARYVKAFVAERKKPHQPLLLVLRRKYPVWRYLAGIYNSIPASTDPLDRRAIYFQRRSSWPQKSYFPDGRLRISAHLRLGDLAAFSTPWGTWVYRVRGIVTPRWVETRDEHQFLQLTATDFHQFIRNLVLHFPPDTTSVQLFSDGFERTMTELSRVAGSKMASPSLSRPVCRLLRKDLKRQQQQLVSFFKSIPDGTCFVGEKRGQLLKLIHAAITSDVIITADWPQRSLLCQLAGFYATPATRPVILLLQKFGTKEKRRYQADDEPKTISADIAEPDFPKLVERIMTMKSEINGVRLDQDQ